MQFLHIGKETRTVSRLEFPCPCTNAPSFHVFRVCFLRKAISSSFDVRLRSQICNYNLLGIHKPNYLDSTVLGGLKLARGSPNNLDSTVLGG
jgi:hypothetical protein